MGISIYGYSLGLVIRKPKASGIAVNDDQILFIIKTQLKITPFSKCYDGQANNTVTFGCSCNLLTGKS